MTETIISILGLLLGGGLGTFITFKAVRKKANAEADKIGTEVKANELDNVQEAVKIWREMAEELKKELETTRTNYKKVSEEVQKLRGEVIKLTNINNKMVRLLGKITSDNLLEMIEKIKKIHESI